MAPLEVTLAGAVSMRRGDRLADERLLAGRQVRLVAAMLVLERASPLDVDVIAAELWPDGPPDHWRVAVRNLVTRVRHVLTDLGLPAESIVGRDGRYHVDLHAVRVDLELAIADTQRAAGLLDEGRAEQARTAASAARAVLARPVLPGVHASWVDQLRARLDDRHLRVLLLLGECRSLLGDHVDARSVLEEAVALDPLREDAWRLLMRAEAAGGNAAGALRAFARCRRTLADELGVDPSDVTQQVHTEILQAIPQPSPESGPEPGLESEPEFEREREPEPTPAAGSDDRPGPVGEPYVGLRRFDRADADRFFGRDTEVQALVERLERRGLVLVVGPSGVGKSSLVRAGLLPALARGAVPESDTWLQIVLTPGPHPLKALSAELTTTAGGAATSDVETRLRSADDDVLHHLAGDLLAGRPAAARLLLVVDQFEEVFTQAHEEEATRTVDLLVAATRRRDRRIVVVLVLRADFYARAARKAALVPVLNHDQFVVPPLAGEQVEEAVAGPARQAGLRLEAGLLGRILTDVANEPGALPLLQHLLFELWTRRTGDVMTRGTYEDLGGVGGALAAQAELVYARFDAGDRAVARRVLLRGVQPGDDTGDARRVIAHHELLGEDDDDRVDRVVGDLVEARLLTAGHDAATGRRTYELAHEALMTAWPRLRRLVDEARSWLLRHRRLTATAHDWVRHDRHDDWLLTGLALDEANDLLRVDARGEGDVQLSPDERDLVEASLAARERDHEAARLQREHERRLERRARRRLQVLVGVAVLVALVAGAAWWNAARQERIAQADELLAEAADVVVTDPELAILLAREAGDSGGFDQQVEHDTATVRHAAVAANRVAWFTRDDGAVLAWTSDGALVASGRPEQGPDGFTVEVREPRSGDVLATLPGHGGSGTPGRSAFGPGDDLLATAGDDGAVRLWDWEQEQEIARIAGPAGFAAVEIAWHPDGEVVVGTWWDRQLHQVVQVWRTDPPELLHEEQPRDRGPSRAPAFPMAARFSPDGSLLAMVFADVGIVEVLDTSTWEPVHEIRAGDASSVAFSPDGARLAIAGRDLTLVDPSTGTVRALLDGPGPTATSGHDHAAGAAWSRDGTHVALGTQPVHVWRIDEVEASGDTTEPLVLGGASLDGPVVTFAGDQLRAGSFGGDGIRAWELGDRSPAEIAWLPGTTASMQMGVDWSPDGEVLAAPAGLGDLVLWNTATWEADRRFRAHEAAPPIDQPAILNLDFAPTGDRVATAGFDGVHTWDLDGEQVFSRPDTGWTEVSFDDAGELLVHTDEDGRAFVVDDRGRTLASHDFGADVEVEAVRLHPAGDVVAAARYGTPEVEAVVLWDWRRDQHVELVTHTPWNVHWDDAGQRLLVATGTEAAIWDVGDVGDEGLPDEGLGDDLATTTFSGHGDVVQEAVWSPDERRVATCGWDGTARLWDAASGAELQRVVSSDLVGACRVRFSPDGRRLAISDVGQGVRVFTLDPDELAEIAEATLTRTWTAQECAQYPKVTTCPP